MSKQLDFFLFLDSACTYLAANRDYRSRSRSVGVTLSPAMLVADEVVQ